MNAKLIYNKKTQTINCVDNTGKEIKDLLPEDFIIKMNGKPERYIQLKWNTNVNGYQFIN